MKLATRRSLKGTLPVEPRKPSSPSFTAMHLCSCSLDPFPKVSTIISNLLFVVQRGGPVSTRVRGLPPQVLRRAVLRASARCPRRRPPPRPDRRWWPATEGGAGSGGASALSAMDGVGHTEDAVVAAWSEAHPLGSLHHGAAGVVQGAAGESPRAHLVVTGRAAGAKRAASTWAPSTRALMAAEGSAGSGGRARQIQWRHLHEQVDAVQQAPTGG